jgi:uncharacterized repeat protein (TIGR04076 family)
VSAIPYQLLWMIWKGETLEVEMSAGSITILSRKVDQALIEAYEHETVAPCPLFREGQEFIISRWDVPPEGFCEWAWADLQGKIQLAQRLGTVVACCTDAFRPVVFEIRRNG